MKILTWGICLVVFCLPLYLVQFSIFDIPTTVLELMIYALFAFWLVKSFKFSEFKKLFVVHRSLLIAIFLILIGVSLATIFSSDLRTSAGIWKAWFIDPLLFFIIVVTVIKNFSQVKKVLYSLFLSGTVVSVISLIYLIQGRLDPMGRLQAFYNSPNYLAMYLAPALIIGFWFLIRFSSGDYSLRRPFAARAGMVSAEGGRAGARRSVTPRWGVDACLCGSSLHLNIILLSIICLLLSIVFTHSFGVWLGIIAAVCFGLLLYLFKLKKTGLAWTILCLGLVVVLVLGYLALTQRESSFDARLVIWQKAWQVFKIHPVLGIGLGTFGDYFPSYPEWGVPQPHNLFLAFLLQAGILGFIGWMWLLIWFFRTGFKRCKSLNVNCQLLIVLMSVMAYILIHGLIDTTYWKNDLSAIFWLIIGLMAVLKIRKLKI